MIPTQSDLTQLRGLQRLQQCQIMVQVKVIIEEFKLADQQ